MNYLFFSVREVHNLLPSDDRKIMKYFNHFPAQSGVGKMFVGNETDSVFHSDDVISWQNEIGKSGVLQWLGWQDETFSNQMLRISFWIMFVDTVPESGVTEESYRNGGFGVKVRNNLCLTYGWLYEFSSEYIISEFRSKSKASRELSNFDCEVL